jgi:hypothetical protein
MGTSSKPAPRVTVLPPALAPGTTTIVEKNGGRYIEVVRTSRVKSKWVSAAELDLIAAALATGEPQGHITLDDEGWLIFARPTKTSKMWLSVAGHRALLDAITTYQSEHAPVLEPAA